MTIQVELTAEAEAQLAAEAQAQGIPPEECAGRLLQARLTAPPAPSGKMTLEEFHKMLEEIREGSEKLPNPPTSSFTRESFYEDRG